MTPSSMLNCLHLVLNGLLKLLHLKLSDICQESIYTCKLYELPPGTSKKAFNTLCDTNEVQKIKILVSEKQYPKDVSFSENFSWDWQLNLSTATSASNLCDEQLSWKSLDNSSLWVSFCYN